MGLTVNAALVASIIASPTVGNFIFTWLVFVLFWSTIGQIKDQRPVVWSACAGAVWPTITILLNAATIVIASQRFQGQLYDEDGPGGFAIKTVVVIAIFALPGFLIGLIPGVAVLAANESRLQALHWIGNNGNQTDRSTPVKPNTTDCN